MHDKQKAATNTVLQQAVKEERQAEFLVRQFFPWTAVSEVAVMTAAAAQRVQTALVAQEHRPVVSIRPQWYY
ncbi:MAG: DUF4433 domain-containing protein [Myxococcales bacterium]|nr:DUF4433 domain-containing protein [Myxococcales bacterium]